jgi:LPXTG-motif cell wall-anchored protein
VTENGQPVAAELIVENDQALVLRSQDFELRLRGACTTGCSITNDATGRETIHLDRNGGARVSGFGFLPGSLVHVWIFSEPRYLGALLVAPDGTYEGTFPLTDIAVGGHTLQTNGFSFDNVPRSANLGIVVVDNLAPTPGPTALPATGTNTTNLALWAALLALLGGITLTARRARTCA